MTKMYKQLETPVDMSPQEKRFKELHLVEFESLAEVLAFQPKDAENIKNFPLRFQPHQDNPEYFCISWEFGQQAPAPNIRQLWITWSTVIPASALSKNGEPVYEDNPLLRPALITVGYYNYTRRVRMAYDKKAVYHPKKGYPVPNVPVVTTAGETLFVQDEDQVRVFNCQKNVKGLPTFMAKGGMFRNSDTVKVLGVSFDPGMLVACDITLSSPRFEAGRSYYIMDYKLIVAPDKDGHCQKTRNAGFHERAYEVQRLANGAKIAVPYLKAITVGKPEQPVYPSSAVLLTPGGIAYRAPGKGQAKNTPFEQRTGPVLSTEGNLASGVGLTEKEWKSAELQFWTKLAIPFKTYIPLV